MRKILLTRHGETAWNALGKLQGHTDIPLSEVGRGQARALAVTLAGAGVTAVWTSDLGRAVETGAIVAAALDLPAPIVEPELRERRFGAFEGLTREECAAHHAEAWAAWQSANSAPPGGEPRDHVVARIGAVLRRIAATDPDAGPALVVTHGGVMRLWLMSLLGPAVPLIANGATYVVEHAASGVTAAPRRS